MSAARFLLNTPLLQTATAIVKTLHENGFAAYFVGGCVRDLVMGRQPKDVDIATSAPPDSVQELFPNTVAVGEQFGVVIVILNNIHFEVATFRAEGSYSDGRHPDQVRYSNSPEEDAKRRDFTLNALFYDPVEGKLLDFHEGRQDIERRIIRAIGNPQQRLQEDKLRMLRAVRFAVRFDSIIETETEQAIVAAASEITQVSPERLRDELTRILTEGHSHRGFHLLEELGLLAILLPELIAMKGVEQPPEFHPEGDVWVHTMRLLKFMDETKEEVSGVGCPVLGESGKAREPGSQKSEVTAQKPEVGSQKLEDAERRSLASPGNGQMTTGDLLLHPDTRHPTPDTSTPWQLDPEDYPTPILAWGALLHDVGKPSTFRLATDRIRFDGHMEVGARMARQIGHRFRMSNEEIELLAELVLEHLKFKDVQKMRPSTLKRFVRREHFAVHLELHRLDCLACHGNLEAYHFTRGYAEALKPEDARPKPLLTGNDLIGLGYTPGPEFKKILTALEDAQLENQITDRESALDYLQKRYPP
ncbi:MAG: HDIG domain-containing metalloprotein [Terriglobia bacterium]